MSQIALPLAGTRVLDLSRVLAGPYCGMMLADMGADVIKVESLDGDDTRRFTASNYKGVSTYFLTVNRNKQSIALDLKAPAARAAFLRLVAQSDVVLENFRTGVMERLDLGYETLKAVRPSLVYCAISGYGRSGPNIDVPGYDPVAQAESGLMSMIGEPDRQPMRVGPSVVDLVTGLYSAQAISAALRHVALTGEGRLIEATLHETALNMLANFAGAHLMTGEVPTRSGNNNQVAQPADVYSGTDGDFMIAVINNAQFAKLCHEVIGRPDMVADPRFLDTRDRLKNQIELQRILTEIFAKKPRAAWIAALRASGLPSGAVTTVGEALSNELVQARGTVRHVGNSTVGNYPVLRTPARLHDSAEVPPIGAPALGEHTREVLQAVAGLSVTEVDALVASGAASTSA